MIVHAMLIPGSVGRPEYLMANVSAGAEDAIESLSFPTFHHDRTAIHSIRVHSARSMLRFATRWSPQCERCSWLLRLLRLWVAWP